MTDFKFRALYLRVFWFLSLACLHWEGQGVTAGLSSLVLLLGPWVDPS
jgi:hypothetical protein